MIADSAQTFSLKQTFFRDVWSRKLPWKQWSGVHSDTSAWGQSRTTFCIDFVWDCSCSSSKSAPGHVVHGKFTCPCLIATLCSSAFCNPHGHHFIRLRPSATDSFMPPCSVPSSATRRQFLTPSLALSYYVLVERNINTRHVLHQLTILYQSVDGIFNDALTSLLRKNAP